MKKLFVYTALILALSFCFSAKSMAQKISGSSYTTALGIRLDVGNGGTFVGPAVKHFFDANNAGEASLLFGNHLTFLGAEYSWNDAIRGAQGLKWNAGIGPQFAFYSGGSDVFIRPFVGLEFKIPQAPLDLGFDWRPALLLTHGSDFEAGRFGLAFRFTLN